MVLVSHSHRFIYSKTGKSASTSVEDYFLPYCMPHDRIPPNVGPGGDGGGIPGWDGPEGIVGCRPQLPDAVWYNHMPLAEIQRLLDPEIFDSYLKFCVVRNPFDRIVSRFFFRQTREARAALAVMPFDEVRQRFAAFVKEPDNVGASVVAYVIRGKVAVDMIIRYERLLDDLEAACDRLGIAFEPERLGRKKSGFRQRPEPFEDYYDANSRDVVAQIGAFDIEQFGYACGKPQTEG